MSPKKATKKSAKRSTASGRAYKGLSAEEVAAMKETLKERKASGSKEDAEKAVLEKIAEMKGSDRAMAKQLHAIIKASAPSLSPKTWYGMPAYANQDGKIVCFFQAAAKFKARYATFGFSDPAHLDEGNMWPTSWAMKGLTAADEVKDQRAGEESGELRAELNAVAKEIRLTDHISPRQFHDSEGVGDWRVLGDGACSYFQVGSFAAGARLVQAISELPGVDDLHPDVDVRYDGLTVRLITITDEYAGMTRRHVELARQISAAARQLGLTADPSAVQSLLVIPGATSRREVMPFWRAVLGYVPRPDSPDEDLVDPRNRGAPFWFEQMNEPRPDGGGAIHVAIWVPYEQAEARMASALAAGGRMVRDEFAPSWWTLADAAGNEADIATTMGRDG